MREEDKKLQELLKKNQSDRPDVAHAKKYEYTEYDEDSPIDFKTRKFVQWTTSNDQQYFPASKTCRALPPGVYDIDVLPNQGIFFNKIEVTTEGLIRFPETNSNKVIDEIQKFWERESLFLEYNLTYKRGILLWGPAGSGKTSTVKLLCHDVIQRDGVVINFTEPDLFIEGMRLVRAIQPKCPVVILMEDLDAIIEQFNESQVLNILDGVEKVERVVFLATTNYPENLGDRIVNRPSRFDKRFLIGHPEEESRRMYFEHLIGNKKIEELKIDINRWVADTDQLSLAHLKELFIAVIIQGDKYEEEIEVLQSMRETIKSRDYEDDGDFGFQKKAKRKK
jgi:GTPase SAR1 family protein